tara:strand:- start:2806 stop:3816 length:1011 start_codon:yes stop_codon:yes gene_type:complete
MINNLSKLCLDNKGVISPLIIPAELTNGTGLCNVSIYDDKEHGLIANVRHVHYTLYHCEFDQNFYSYWGPLAYLNPEENISLITGNYLCKLNDKTLQIDHFNNINTSKHDVTPLWEFQGLEDARVFRWDKLYVCGVRRDTKPNGEGRMELCEISWKDNDCLELTRDRIQPPEQTYLEKNWMPILDMPFCFVRWANPLEIVEIDPETKSSEVLLKSDNKLDLPFELRGSSQVIPWKDGMRICITHDVDFWYHDGPETCGRPGFKDSHYYHRFIIWDKDWNLIKISKMFKFMDTRIEFCCGLVYKDNNFIISYGFQDNAAFALKMPENVLEKLEWEVL